MSFKMVNGKHPLLEEIGLNRTMMAGGLSEMVESMAGGAYNAGSSFWNEDYQSFGHVAEGINGTVTGALNVGFGAAFGYAAHNKMGFYNHEKFNYFENVYKKGGNVFTVGPDNVPNRALRGGLPGMERHNLLNEPHPTQGATKGVWKQPKRPFAGRGPSLAEEKMPLRGFGKFHAGEGGNAFSRFMFGWKGVAAFAALQVGAYVAGKGLSMAAQMLDEAHLAYNQSKYNTYDSRMFNNRGMQTWGMQNQQAAMTASIPFEQNMMSIARVYHSRG